MAEYKTVRRDIRFEPSVNGRIERVIDFLNVKGDGKYNFSKFSYKAILNEVERVEKLINEV